MVVKGLSTPKLLAYMGFACLACIGFGLTAQSSVGDDQKGEAKAEAEPEQKGEAKPEAANADAPKEESKTSKEEPNKEEAKEASQEALPEVTFVLAAPEGEADAVANQPVYESIKAFAHAFNTRDVKSLTAMFTPQAEITNQVEHVTRGSAAIQEIFGKLFAEQPTVKIQFEVHSLRFLSPDLAIEEGISTMTSTIDEAVVADHDRYTVTHVKHEGKWLVASARDWPSPPPSREEELKQLDWLIGDWVDENGDTLVATSYRWSEDKNYLLSDYSVHRRGQAPRKGTQRVAWDPRVQKLHSWNFDTAGGFTEGLWTRSDNQWIVKITGVSADGQTRSGTNILTRLSQDHATYQSRDRVMGGEVLPDLEELPIVRKPPEPSRAAK